MVIEQNKFAWILWSASLWSVLIIRVNYSNTNQISYQKSNASLLLSAFLKIHIATFYKNESRTLIWAFRKAPSMESELHFEKHAGQAYRPRIWIFSYNSHIRKQESNAWGFRIQIVLSLFPFKFPEGFPRAKDSLPLGESPPWLLVRAEKALCFHCLSQNRH